MTEHSWPPPQDAVDAHMRALEQSATVAGDAPLADEDQAEVRRLVRQYQRRACRDFYCKLRDQGYTWLHAACYAFFASRRMGWPRWS